MAAITITPTANPFSVKHTLSATPNTQQEFKIPGSARRVEVYFETNAGKVIWAGGTDAAVISTEAAYPITADVGYYWDLPQAQQTHSVWLASGTGSTVVHVAVFE